MIVLRVVSIQGSFTTKMVRVSLGIPKTDNIFQTLIRFYYTSTSSADMRPLHLYIFFVFAVLTCVWTACLWKYRL